MSIRLQLLFFTLVILCAGCRKEEPNPENLDRIYSDLMRIQGEKEAALASEKKAIISAQKAIEEAVPQTLDLKNGQRDLAKAKNNVDRIEQEIHFLSIRAKRRFAEDRYHYQLAFAAGKENEWPPREEYEAYSTNMRLNDAPRFWSAHLPKLFDRKPAAKKKEEKKEEE